MAKAPTIQQAYNGIRKYFSKPGAEIAFDHKTMSCCYKLRGENNRILKCAVGCLIPPSEYQHKFDDENQLAWEVAIAVWPGIDKDTMSFLGACQELHDNSNGVMSFLYDLDELAKNCNLKVAAE